MKPNARVVAISAAALLISACVSGPDRFYSLQPVPAAAASARQQFIAEVSVRVSVPSVVDRNQIVLDVGSSMQVLEHERWASPLSDQLTTTLGQDLEQRRPDVLITSRPLSQGTGLARFAIQVEIVTLNLRRNGAVQMEVRWRVDPSGDRPSSLGREMFSEVPADGTAAAIAAALSRCVANLAERLASAVAPIQP